MQPAARRFGPARPGGQHGPRHQAVPGPPPRPVARHGHGPLQRGGPVANGFIWPSKAARSPRSQPTPPAAASAYISRSRCPLPAPSVTLTLIPHSSPAAPSALARCLALALAFAFAIHRYRRSPISLDHRRPSSLAPVTSPALLHLALSSLTPSPPSFSSPVSSRSRSESVNHVSSCSCHSLFPHLVVDSNRCDGVCLILWLARWLLHLRHRAPGKQVRHFP